MALQKSVTFRGITLPTAYIRVWRFEGTKTSLTVGVEYCASAADPRFDAATYTLPYSLLGDNPLKQAYEYLKTQPDFAGSTDVLEAGQTA